MTEANESLQPPEQKAPEIPRGSWETLLFIQRHGRYDNARPADYNNLTDEERLSLGRLTSEGVREAGQRADERIGAIFGQDAENTDFLIINSPTFWLDHPELGQRAAETARIIYNHLSHGLLRLGLGQDQVLNRILRKDGTTVFKGDSTRSHHKLGESQMFQFPEYVGFMRQKYEGQSPRFWAARNADLDRESRKQHKSLRTSGRIAPGPMEDAKEVSDVVILAARFARAYHNLRLHPENEGRRLVVWLVTHGDGLDPYAQRVINIPPAEFTAGYNEGFGIAIDREGNARVEVRDNIYPVQIPDQGKEVHIRSNEEIDTA